MTLVAVGRVLVGDVGVGGGALVEEIARQRPGGEAVAAQRKTLLVLLVAVEAFGTRGGVRPTEIEAAAGAAAPRAMRTARHAHHWWRRNSDTVHDGGCDHSAASRGRGRGWAARGVSCTRTF